MITKDYNGTSLSANYNTAVATSPRKWQVGLYLNGTLLDCAIASLEIKKGSCGSGESFSLGNIFSSMMTAELLELTTDIKGEDIEVRIGLETSPGTTEWITAGWFTAIEVVKQTLSTSVTAYGFSTSKTGGSFTIPATLSLSNIATAIATATGLTVTFGSGINTAKVLDGTLESGISCYGGLQVLAHAVGGYAVDTNDGNLAIKQFSDTSTLSVDLDRMLTQPNIEEQTFDITGVQVNTGRFDYVLTSDVAIDPDKTYYTRSGTAPDYVYTPVDNPDVADIGTYYEEQEIVYTSGSPVVLYDTNANMSSDVFGIYDDIVGYSYYTGSIDLSIGDPRIQGDDVVTVTVGADTYIMPCHMVTHSYDGGLSTTIEAVKATADGDGIYSVAPITQRMDEIGLSASIARNSAESAKAYAEEAKQTTDEINAYAQVAGKTVTQILQDGETAGTSAQQALASAQSASEYASRALGNLSTVQSVAETLTWITQHGTMTLTTDVALDPTHVYFVLDAQGDYTVGGNTYAIVTEPNVDDIGTYYVLSIDESLNNYVGTHLAVDSEGLWLIPEANGNKVLIATGSGSTYTIAGTYIMGKVNNTDVTLAKFTQSGLSITTNDGLNDVEIANLGYGEGTYSGGTTGAPYYTLGQRKTALYQYSSTQTYHRGDMCIYNGKTYVCVTSSTTGSWSSSAWDYYIGSFSTAEGYSTIACRQSAHAEGYGTSAIGAFSHAEGESTTAIGAGSHAEGRLTTARVYSHAEGEFTNADGSAAHAEGLRTEANGDYSHSQNWYTLASSTAQTALGKFNVDDTASTYAVIVGNGTADNARSNALAVTWDGNVEIDLPNYQTASTTDKSIYDTIVALGWDSEVLS